MTQRQKIENILQKTIYCINLYFSVTETLPMHGRFVIRVSTYFPGNSDKKDRFP